MLAREVFQSEPRTGWLFFWAAHGASLRVQ